MDTEQQVASPVALAGTVGLAAGIVALAAGTVA